MSKFLHNNETRAMTVTWSLLQNETAKMAVDHSPEILRGPWQFFLGGVGGGGGGGCFREEEFWRISYVCIVQVAPIHQSYFYWRFRISRTAFEKGHPNETFLWNYFKIW